MKRKSLLQEKGLLIGEFNYKRPETGSWGGLQKSSHCWEDSWRMWFIWSNSSMYFTDNHMLTWAEVSLSSMFNLNHYNMYAMGLILSFSVTEFWSNSPKLKRTGSHMTLRKYVLFKPILTATDLFTFQVITSLLCLTGLTVYVLSTRLRMVCLCGLLLVVMASVCVPSFGSVCWDNSICKDLGNMGRILVGH